MKKIWFLFVIFIINVSVSKGKIISSPLSLNSLVNAKPLSMAGTYIAYSQDINGILYNPAGLVFSENNQFNFTFNRYIGEIKKSTVGILYNKHTYAISVMGNYYFLSLDQIDGYGIKVGEIVNEDIISLLGVSWKLKEMFSFGISVKYMYTSIGYYSHKFLFSDYGFYWKMSDINIGLVIKNMGISLDDEKGIIIPTFNWGIFKKLEYINLLIGMDVCYDIEKKFSGNIGGEYTILKGIFLRGGYKLTKTLAIYTYGIGIKTFFLNNEAPLIIDCGVADYGYLGRAYTVSLVFNF